MFKLILAKQMFYMHRRDFWVIVGLSFFSVLGAQEKYTRENYIDTYADLAMREMVRTGIPASITLAQGCLESDNGNSRLARDAKNHFGIKCHDDWKGRKIYHDDDERNECFRKYKNVEESFTDHSDFLTTKSRYAELFELKPDDYKAWARGLKKAGYATSSKYADHLINIIEENQLYDYDLLVLNREPGPLTPAETPFITVSHREILTNNRTEYIVVKPGDTPGSLREELALFPWELFRYNDIDRSVALDSGMVIYLQPKRWKAESGSEFHEVKEGETLWQISQLYGVKLSRIRRMNGLTAGEEPVVGGSLWLRRSNPLSEKNIEKPVEPELKEDASEMQFEFDEF